MKTAFLPLGLIAPLLLLQAGCDRFWDPFQGDCGGYAACDNADDSGITDTEETGDTDTFWKDTDSGFTTDTDDTGLGLMDDPGDYFVIDYESDYIPLQDAGGDESNRDMQFYAVVVNTSDEELTVRLSYSSSGRDSGLEGPPPPSSSSGHHAEGPSTSKQAPTEKWTPPDFSREGPPPDLSSADIGVAADEFEVRSDFTNDQTYDTVAATLWALGETVAIFVDDRAPIDWDYDCDGEIDQPADNPAYGFDNCDLDTVADIVDTNIVPNFTDLFGETSDIDDNGLISVLITPVLNEIPRSSPDTDDHASIVPSYTDPKVDLQPYDYTDNPGSDEQEVIYVFAPDPYGFYNPQKTTSVDAYTSQELVGQIARGLYKLISYNHKVIVNEGSAQERWLNQAMGAVGIDIVGFGAVFHQDAWVYLDAPNVANLTPLANEGDAAFFSTNTIGPQYLFGRWLVDTYGTDILGKVTEVAETGTDGVESAVAKVADSAEFNELARDFHIALFATGLEGDDGAALIPGDFVRPFADATTITADTTPPTDGLPGQYYGANGYQTGFNVRGVNSFFEGGTTSTPTENLGRRVVTDGSDFQTYVPGFPYFGYTVGGHSGFVSRLVDVPYDEAYLEIQGGESSLLGTVVRLPDPVSPDYAVEQIYSSTDANPVELPALPDDGTSIYALGEITEADAVQVLDGSSGSDIEDVEDTDRWLLDLTDRPASAVVSLAVWLERKYENSEGDVGPYDPWLAILPADVVPTPTVDDFHYDATCDGAAYWQYPNTVIRSIYTQYYLSASTGLEEGEVSAPVEETACGERELAGEDDTADTGLYVIPSCDDDWDGDGIAESAEPAPGDFVSQIHAYQCALNGGTLDGVTPVDEEIFDADERDEDDDVGFSTLYNTGGTAAEGGEEALLYATLNGGQKYILIVSGGGDTGFYEVSMKQLN